MDFIVEGAEVHRDNLRISKYSSTPFSEGLQILTTIFIGELNDSLKGLFKEAEKDVNYILQVLIKKVKRFYFINSELIYKKYVQKYKPDMNPFMIEMSANAVVGYITRAYQLYRTLYPGRIPTRTPAPSSFTQIPIAEKKCPPVSDTIKSTDIEKLLQTPPPKKSLAPTERIPIPTFSLGGNHKQGKKLPPPIPEHLKKTKKDFEYELIDGDFSVSKIIYL